MNEKEMFKLGNDVAFVAAMGVILKKLEASAEDFEDMTDIIDHLLQEALGDDLDHSHVRNYAYQRIETFQGSCNRA